MRYHKFQSEKISIFFFIVCLKRVENFLCQTISFVRHEIRTKHFLKRDPTSSARCDNLVDSPWWHNTFRTVYYSSAGSSIYFEMVYLPRAWEDKIVKGSHHPANSISRYRVCYAPHPPQRLDRVELNSESDFANIVSQKIKAILVKYSQRV